MPIDLTPLLQVGAVGAILGWILVQTNPRLERRVSTCAAHQAFVEDQLWLDRLVFLRRIAERLNAQEWDTGKKG